MMFSGLGSSPQLLYTGQVPITCATDEQPTPITAWVNNPDEPGYLAASNWKCVKKAEQSLQAGFTYGAGLKTWANPLYAAATAVTALPHFQDSPQYILGLWTPIVALGAILYAGRTKR